MDPPALELPIAGGTAFTLGRGLRVPGECRHRSRRMASCDDTYRLPIPEISLPDDVRDSGSVSTARRRSSNGSPLGCPGLSAAHIAMDVLPHRRDKTRLQAASAMHAANMAKGKSHFPFKGITICQKTSDWIVYSISAAILSTRIGAGNDFRSDTTTKPSDSPGQHDVFAGKLFEYLGLDVGIICVISKASRRGPTGSCVIEVT